MSELIPLVKKSKKNTRKKSIEKIDMIDKIIATTTKFSLFFGAIILGYYFFSINYIPVENLSSMLHILSALAALGFGFLIYVVLTFIFTPLIWEILLKNIDTCKIIVGEKNVDEVINSYNNKYINIEQTARVRIFFFYFFSFGAYLAASLLLLYIKIKKILLIYLI